MMFEVKIQGVTVEFTASYNDALAAFNGSKTSFKELYQLTPSGQKRRILWKI